MSFALIYWLLMLIWLIFTVWTNIPFTSAKPHGGSLLLFILLLLLGWKVFGPPIHS